MSDPIKITAWYEYITKNPIPIVVGFALAVICAIFSYNIYFDKIVDIEAERRLQKLITVRLKSSEIEVRNDLDECRDAFDKYKRLSAVNDAFSQYKIANTETSVRQLSTDVGKLVAAIEGFSAALQEGRPLSGSPPRSTAEQSVVAQYKANIGDVIETGIVRGNTSGCPRWWLDGGKVFRDKNTGLADNAGNRVVTIKDVTKDKVGFSFGNLEKVFYVGIGEEAPFAIKYAQSICRYKISDVGAFAKAGQASFSIDTLQ